MSHLILAVGKDGAPWPNGEPGGKGGAIIFTDKDAEVVRFSYSGGIEVNNRFAPDEAARRFWAVVSECVFPRSIANLDAENARLRSVLGESRLDPKHPAFAAASAKAVRDHNDRIDRVLKD